MNADSYSICNRTLNTKKIGYISANQICINPPPMALFYDITFSEFSFTTSLARNAVLQQAWFGMQFYDIPIGFDLKYQFCER